jgi:hypothetical protein
MRTGHPRLLKFRRVRDDVRTILFEVLQETNRCDQVGGAENLIPKGSVPQGWEEKSGASWAGFLKQVEQRLRSTKAEYQDLIVTATDGHKTWNMPLTITIHLITSKILAANSAARAALRHTHQIQR